MKTKNKRQKLNHPSKHYNESELERFIPDDIIYDILIRVPARDLVSSKRVRKSWKDIIESREFSAAHLKYWKSRFDIILLLGLFPYQDFVSMDIRTKTTYQLNLANKDYVILLDSLDGLILFRVTYNQNQLYVCNPLIKKFKMISCLLSFYKSIRTFYRLVFDPALQKYKIIGFCYGIHNIKYCVLVLNDNSDIQEVSLVWRNVETGFRHLLRYEFNTVLVNGLLCWLAHSIAERIEDTVVYVQSMDIVGEKFKEKIMLPCQPGDNYSTDCSLLQMENVEGSLNVAIPENQNELGIWILIDWDKYIWVKKYNIYNDEPLHFSKRFTIMVLMDSDGTEEVKFIAQISGKLCSYSLKGQHREENSVGSPRFTYVPSLIFWD